MRVHYIILAMQLDAAFFAASSFASGSGTGDARLRVGRAVERAAQKMECMIDMHRLWLQGPFYSFVFYATR